MLTCIPFSLVCISSVNFPIGYKSFDGYNASVPTSSFSTDDIVNDVPLFTTFASSPIIFSSSITFGT